MARTGILGGTFDPPHLGHTALAVHARDQFRLDKVLWIPAGDPYHRRAGSGFRIAGARRNLSAPADRLAMTLLAVAGGEGFTVDEREIRRAGPSYTVDTLLELAGERQGDELFLLLGADSAAEFHRWRRPERIGELARVVVAPRRFVRTDGGSANMRLESVDMPQIDITSTAVRSLVRSGKPFRHLVEPSVADYIVGHGLYVGSGPY